MSEQGGSLIVSVAQVGVGEAVRRVPGRGGRAAVRQGQLALDLWDVAAAAPPSGQGVDAPDAGARRDGTRQGVASSAVAGSPSASTATGGVQGDSVRGGTCVDLPSEWSAAQRDRHHKALAVMVAAGVRPLMPYPGSGKAWQCRCLAEGCGLLVSPSYDNVKQRGRGCNHRPPAKRGEAAALADAVTAGVQPLEPFSGARVDWRVRCTAEGCGEEFTLRLQSVRDGGHGCLFCAGRRVRSRDAVAAMRALDLEPQENFPGSAEDWPCLCLRCDTVVVTRYTTVDQSGRGCDTCRPNARVPEKVAAAVMRAAGLEPLVPYPGANERWACRCLAVGCGREVTPTYTRVKNMGTGCRYCSGNTVDASDALAAMRRADLEPCMDFPGADKPWRCRCSVCGFVTETARYSNIRRGQGGCMKCARRYVSAEDAAALFISRGLLPLAPFPGTMVQWPSLHLACGRIVQPKYNKIQQGQSGCIWCAQRIVDPYEAAEVMRTAGLVPQVPYPGSTTKWPCLCLGCNTVQEPTYSRVQQTASGCGNCFRNLHLPGRSMALYVVINDVLAAVKVGIGLAVGDRVERVRQHCRSGWRLHRLWLGVKDVRLAYRVEAHILRSWRAGDVPYGVDAADMRYGGHTETAPAASVDLKDLCSSIDDALVVARGQLAQENAVRAGGSFTPPLD